MKTDNSIQDIIKHKKNSIRLLNNTLEYYLSEGEHQNLKKAQLISKWILEFSNFIRFEDNFDPKKNIAYKRGDIIKVNFGFNIGSELGGVHYAVVIDNNNRHSSDTLVVIPLSSYKIEKNIYERDLFIGSEFFSLMVSRNKKLIDDAEKSRDELIKIISVLKNTNASETNSDELNKLILDFDKQKSIFEKKIEASKKCLDEVTMMKEGSIVKIEQIRTISKMRIWDPKKTRDILYGIHLSDSTMNKINDKMKELFIH